MNRTTKTLLILSAAAAALAGARISSQNNSPPSNIFYPGLVYDPSRGVTLLFGGVSPDTAYAHRAATYTWDGVVWRAMDIRGPSARAGHGMVYDSRRKRVVLFGGTHRDEPLGDTWGYDGANWERLSTWGPAPRAFFGIAYDSLRDRVVVDGGSQGLGRTIFDDTWEWDGVRWLQVATGGHPKNSFHKMAYDTRRHRVVSFGGRGAGCETWEWDGADWAKVSTDGPSPRDHHAMAFDSRAGRVVVFGGSNQATTGLLLRDLWNWNGSEWTELPSEGVSPRGGLPGLVYDSRRDRLVLVGGGGNLEPEAYAGTWEREGRMWTRVDR